MSKAPQLNVRLTSEQQDVLDAAVFVRGLRSPQVLLEPLLERLTEDLLADEDIARAVDLRRRRTRSDVVRPLAKGNRARSS